jgi:uncharacterized protein (UPF0332 family)
MNDDARERLIKAEDAIGAADLLLRGGYVDFAASRAYYAMFYVAEALLYERGLAFSKHTAVLGAYGKHYARDGGLDTKFHRWLRSAFDHRSEADYGARGSVLPAHAHELIAQARELLHAARQHLGAEPE